MTRAITSLDNSLKYIGPIYVANENKVLRKIINPRQKDLIGFHQIVDYLLNFGPSSL